MNLLNEAKKRITDDLANNQELFMAQIIVRNPEINPLEYTWCMETCYEEGRVYTKHWLEKKI